MTEDIEKKRSHKMDILQTKQLEDSGDDSSYDDEEYSPPRSRSRAKKLTDGDFMAPEDASRRRRRRGRSRRSRRRRSRSRRRR